MNVSLTPQLEAMIREKVESGLYNNASEVVREALRLMTERDRLAWLRAEIAKGIEQHERGETIPYTPELMERLGRDAAANARRGKPVKDAVKP